MRGYLGRATARGSRVLGVATSARRPPGLGLRPQHPVGGLLGTASEWRPLLPTKLYLMPELPPVTVTVIGYLGRGIPYWDPGEEAVPGEEEGRSGAGPPPGADAAEGDDIINPCTGNDEMWPETIQNFLHEQRAMQDSCNICASSCTTYESDVATARFDPTAGQWIIEVCTWEYQNCDALLDCQGGDQEIRAVVGSGARPKTPPECWTAINGMPVQIEPIQ
jgi:hypothetical protein